jgi:hypothetical protein
MVATANRPKIRLRRLIRSPGRLPTRGCPLGVTSVFNISLRRPLVRAQLALWANPRRSVHGRARTATNLSATLLSVAAFAASNVSAPPSVIKSSALFLAIALHRTSYMGAPFCVNTRSISSPTTANSAATPTPDQLIASIAPRPPDVTYNAQPIRMRYDRLSAGDALAIVRT